MQGTMKQSPIKVHHVPYAIPHQNVDRQFSTQANILFSKLRIKMKCLKKPGYSARYALVYCLLYTWITHEIELID